MSEDENGFEEARQYLIGIRGQELVDRLFDKIPLEGKKRIQWNLDLKRQVDESLLVFNTLLGDVRFIQKQFEGDPLSSQIQRRSLYRAAFAWIEGTISQMVTITLKMSSGYSVEALSAEEITCLREETHTLNDDGKIRARTQYLKFLPKIPFVFNSLAKVGGCTFKLDKSRYWEHFQRSIRVRNNLTHPKVTMHLEVSDDALADLECVIKWYDSQLALLFNELTVKLIESSRNWIETQEIIANQLVANFKTMIDWLTGIDAAIDQLSVIGTANNYHNLTDTSWIIDTLKRTRISVVEKFMLENNLQKPD